MRPPAAATLVRTLAAAAILAAAHASAQESTEPAFTQAELDYFRPYGVKTAPERTEGTIRLATYNADFLYDHEDDPELSGGQDDMRFAKDLGHCQNLADAIRAVDADIVALQEVESLEALTWFRDEFLKDAGYEHLASIDVGHAIGLENSVLSRFPIAEAKVWTERELPESRPDPRGFRRSPLMVRVEPTPDTSLTLLVIHHKTGRDEDGWRLAESRGVIELLDEVLETRAGEPEIVLGDMAGDLDEDHIRVYTNAGYLNPIAGKQGNAWYSTTFRERRHAILLNPHAANRFVEDSAFIYGTGGPVDGMPARDARFLPNFASDCFPVCIDLDWPALLDNQNPAPEEPDPTDAHDATAEAPTSP